MLPKVRIIEFVITAIIVLSVNILSFYFQPQITFNYGKGIDGVEYYKIAEDIAAGKQPETRAPFVYRVGTPFLVSVFYGDDIVYGFKLLNIIAGSLIPFALLIWISIYFNGTFFRILPVLLYSLAWHSPLRLSWYYPVHSDPISILILLILLINFNLIRNSEIRDNKYDLSSWYTFYSFAVLTFIGVFFREICIIPALIFGSRSLELNLNKNNYLKSTIKTTNLKYLIPLALGLAGIAIVHFLVHKTNSYSFIAAAYSWVYRKSLVMNLHALLIAFGPVLFLIVFSIRSNWDFLKSRVDLLIFLIIILIMGFAGGSDSERILFWSMPVVYLLINNSIKNNKKYLTNPIFLLLIFSGQIINMRALWITPDYPNNYTSVMPILTPLTDKFPLLDLWTWHGNLKVNLVSFAGYIILFILCSIVFYLTKFHYRKQS